MAGEESNTRSKNSKREKLRSALSHRKAANEWLDSIRDSQDKWNATTIKIGNDTALEFDTDYEATGAIIDVYEADGEGSDAQHKRSLRETMRSALAHNKLADEMVDALEESQASYNAMLVKLDAEGGTLNDTDYASSLSLDELDKDGEGSDAQHKQSLRRSLRSALADRRLADQMLDAMQELQARQNDGLAQLDTSDPNEFGDLQVAQLLDPDSE